ncbi:hypothetical protein CB0940_03034 [Cercospora beticola]|uniref:F-box domain-containing protein n=1 Tax=Cercospora beticola TaxID=122368 RepID=A0A2G5I4U2_CERBT|nr:hypothetical protein CB0940_03034 [Cercospora beticola]PIA99522.1 hypothetical protein CB0940_03034 [Cercospora beticola]WPB00202.1 hypothetical protein RHO25_004821 [Cercospora beticola]CAK1361606.1 unnamed protein product [Cercospora beticola]
MSTPQLDNLPDEVNECINVCLGLYDLVNLRLVSRSMLTKTTQRHLGSFLRSKRLDLTRPSLELMAEMTAKHRLGCVIEELTLVGVVYNTKALQYQIWTGSKELVGDCDEYGHVDVPTEFGSEADLARATVELEELKRQRADYDQWHAAGKDVALLTEIFANLAANTKLQGLVSIATDVAVFREDSSEERPHTNVWVGGWYGKPLQELSTP